MFNPGRHALFKEEIFKEVLNLTGNHEIEKIECICRRITNHFQDIMNDHYQNSTKEFDKKSFDQQLVAIEDVLGFWKNEYYFKGSTYDAYTIQKFI